MAPITRRVPERVFRGCAAPPSDLEYLEAGGVEERQLGGLLRSLGLEGNYPPLKLEVTEGSTGGSDLHEREGELGRWRGGVENIGESEDL